jgi:hypothetical protein
MVLFTTGRLGGTEKEVKRKVKIILGRGKTWGFAQGMRYLDGGKIDSLPDSLRPDSLPEWECQRKSGKGHVASTLPEWNGTLSRTN